MNDHSASSTGPGKRIRLDPDNMDDLARRFLRDADDFHGQVGPIRQAMSNGTTGWNSASNFPALQTAIEKHRTKMRDAEKFMAAVTDDLAIMSRNTSFLKHTLLGQDHGNGDLLNQMVGKLPNQSEDSAPRSGAE